MCVGLVVVVNVVVASVPRSSFPAYLSSETATPYYAPEATEFRGVSSDFVQREVTTSGSGLYSVYDVSGTGARTAPSVSGLGADPGETSTPYYAPESTQFRGVSSDFVKREVTPSGSGLYSVHDVSRIGARAAPSASGLGAGGKVYPPSTEDPNYFGQRRDVSAGIPSNGPDMVKDRHHPSTNAEGPAASSGDSNILSVDGLPTNCTRREVGHLFRPFFGYKDIKVIHKEPRHSGARATVFCFVEFVDAKCALSAMEALQGYKFDDKKPDSPALWIQYAHFPFRPPSDRQGQHTSVPYQPQLHKQDGDTSRRMATNSGFSH